MVGIRFSGDPKRYDLANTYSAVVRDWIQGDITEDEMLALLRGFKLMTTGIHQVLFLKDINTDMLLETAVWFREYGLAAYETR